MAHIFTRTHIPTGRISHGRFNASQHVVFEDFDNYGASTIEAAKQEVINKWNRQQPTEWKYSL